MSEGTPPHFVIGVDLARGKDQTVMAVLPTGAYLVPRRMALDLKRHAERAARRDAHWHSKGMRRHIRRQKQRGEQ